MILNSNYIVAVEAAIEAGLAINSVYHSKDYDIEIKSDDSPVTRADKKASAIIAQYLKQTSFPVIDEEHCCPDYSIRRTWKNYWLVDPMDGTREFISGNGEFTVNIALVTDNTPVFGVIYAPVSGTLFWGGISAGAFKLENVTSWQGMEVIEKKSVKINPENNVSPVLRIAASRSHLDASTRMFIGRLEEKFGEIRFVSKGSSLKLCMIAEGLSDIYPRFSRTMEWDTAAGHAIVSATGGVLLKAETLTELQYNKEELSNPPFFALSRLQNLKQLKYF